MVGRVEAAPTATSGLVGSSTLPPGTIFLLYGVVAKVARVRPAALFQPPFVAKVIPHREPRVVKHLFSPGRGNVQFLHPLDETAEKFLGWRGMLGNHVVLVPRIGRDVKQFRAFQPAHGRVHQSPFVRPNAQATDATLVRMAAADGEFLRTGRPPSIGTRECPWFHGTAGFPPSPERWRTNRAVASVRESFSRSPAPWGDGSTRECGRVPRRS